MTASPTAAGEILMTGITTPDIFGYADGAELAAAGSYGQRPAGFRLPDTTQLGHVVLQVADLDRSVAWYQATLGLAVLSQDGRRAVLGSHGEDRPLVELVEKRGAAPAPHRGRLGLYHFAILLPERAALGRFLRHLSDINARVGAADHLVSEALYLQDPDNLGIEVYADRPRKTWRRLGRELLMASDPLDMPGLLNAAGTSRWEGMPAGTTMGHVHLHVGDLAQASSFYSDALGLDRMVWEYPGALFLAAGGYHHHLGTNTWAGRGASPPTGNDAQLLEWNVELPGTDDVSASAESLDHAGHAVQWDDRQSQSGYVTRDPWGTTLHVRAGSGATT
jgi:catechol 2,3-dioxygenase